MKRLTIKGQPKKDGRKIIVADLYEENMPFMIMIRDKEYCPSCENGKLFGREQIFKTDTQGDNYRECICNVCLTKYRQPLIQLDLEIENFPGERVSMEKFKAWKRNNEKDLTKINEAQHMISIALNYREKVKKMEGMDIEVLRKEYDKTGKCDHPDWITSRPFKTAEGTFSIRNCVVCTIGTMKHKGKEYRDKLMNLVRYLAHMGVEADRKNKEAEKKLDNLFDISDIKNAESSAKEMPSFDIEVKAKPNFDVEVKSGPAF